MIRKKVLVTGANGYIGNAVAKAFTLAGWETYGLIRTPSQAKELALDEIHPLIGSPDDSSFLEKLPKFSFDVIVSNTEDKNDLSGHLENVKVLITKLVEQSNSLGIRPLVMFSSGCKDYGRMELVDGDPGLKPHTEESPLNPLRVLKARNDFGLWLIKEAGKTYDGIVLRPTIVYGHSSSNYGSLFELATKSESTLTFYAKPKSIMHSLHIDDCAAAYVQLAQFPDRSKVANQFFNLSNSEYETASEVGEAIANSYGLKLEFSMPKDDPSLDSVDSLTNFSQWVSSDKIRKLIGWTEKKPAFSKAFEEFRLAYEASKAKNK